MVRDPLLQIAVTDLHRMGNRPEGWDYTTLREESKTYKIIEHCVIFT